MGALLCGGGEVALVGGWADNATGGLPFEALLDGMSQALAEPGADADKRWHLVLYAR